MSAKHTENTQQQFVILDPTESISGYTQHELADLWGQQTGSTPANINPLSYDDTTDPRGRRGSMERYEAFQIASPSGISFLHGGSGVRTILGEPSTVYFAPFINILADNTTFDFRPDSEQSDKFIGGYALTLQHLTELKEQGLNPREFLGFPTLLDLARFYADRMTKQFVKIDEADATPSNIDKYRQETTDVGYPNLPRSTGGFYSQNIYLADPDLGANLEDSDSANDEFPTLFQVQSNQAKEEVIPFVQAGYYFAFQLDPGAHTVKFGAGIPDVGFSQEITYDILNPVYGTRRSETLVGTCDNDYLEGGKGNDKLLGRAGDDLLVGGRGADILKGGAGSDELWGDAGRDIFVFRQRYGSDAIYDFEVGDKIDIRSLPIKSIDEITDEVTLTSGVSGLKLDFGNGDILTLVGIEEKSSLSISNGFITTSQNSSLV